MRTILHVLVVVSGLAVTSRVAVADTHLQVETDPSTFAMSGFAAHLRAGSSLLPRWTIGAGTYALEFPGVMTELAPSNRHEDWEVRLRLGYGLFLDRFIGERVDRGLFVGAQLALQHFEASEPEMQPNQARFVNALVMPRVGYAWYPFDAGFYVLGWLGVGATGTVAGDRGGYDQLPVIAFGAVHLGWRFGI